jgi:hypothetical protein
MHPSEALSLHRTRIREIALSHHVSGVRVFGSALHGDDVSGSDLDLLVEPTPQTTMMDIGAIRFELKNCWGWKWMYSPPTACQPSFGIKCCARLSLYESGGHVLEAIDVTKTATWHKL